VTAVSEPADASAHNPVMQSLLMILPVAAPVLFWGWYHYQKDRHLPEPLGHLVLTFLLGVVAAAISKGLYIALGWISLRYDALVLADTSTTGLLAYSLLAIGPIEEIAKILPFVLVVLRFPEFDEAIDGIIYASFIGLGYAAVENLLYLDYLTMTEAVARGFASPVVHMLFASVWGFTIGCADLRDESLLLGTLKGFAVAALLHGIYDFAVLQNSINALPIAAALILGIWIWRLRLLEILRRAAVKNSGHRTG
jgi:RsiW-degrading membrane proteinase PrsW (M82 family)